MDISKRREIHDLDRLKSLTPRKIPTGSNISQDNSSVMEKTASNGDVSLPDTHDRFEQIFLASPRAKELYASLENSRHRPTPKKSAPLELAPVDNPTPQKATTFKSVPGFKEVVNMANFFHSKHSHSSSSHSVLSDQSLTSGRSKTFADFVSPFKPSVNDRAIKDKVNMAISRLEDNSTGAATCESQGKRQTNAVVGASRDSGFNDLQSDSGGSSEGTFTDIMKKKFRVISEEEGRTVTTIVNKVNTAERAQTVNGEEEVHISFESNSDEEIDVVTADSKGDDNSDDNEDDNNNLTTKRNKRSSEKTLNSATASNTGTSSMNVPAKDAVLDGKDTFNDFHDAVVDEVIPETPQGSVPNRKKREAKTQRKPETKGSNKVESDSSSASAGKIAHKVSKINSLEQWSIKALKTRTHMGIIVEGQRSEDPEGDLWHSTAIVSRLSSRCVQTKSGSQYKLIGPINEYVTLQQGFPSDFVKAFKRGFPKNWVSLVADFFNSQSSSGSEDEMKIQEQLDSEKNRKVSKKAKHSTLTTPTESRAKTKNKSPAFKTPENRPVPKEVEVKTTRSGRMVKPPLAWWRGQRILTDKHHNLEGIDPGGVEHTPISSMYTVNIKLPTKKEDPSPSKTRQAASSSESSDTLSSRRKQKPAQNNKRSSDSNTERDSDENIKRPLFSSPMKTTVKNQTLQSNSPQKQPEHKLKNANKSGNQGNSVGSSAGGGLEHKETTSKLYVQEHDMPSEDELPAHISPQKKNASQLSVMDKNSLRDKKRKNYTNLQTDSESENVEQPMPKILSPPRRVLRSHRSKTNDLKSKSSNPYKFSDVDSEDSQADTHAKRSLKRNASKRNYNKTSESEAILSSCDERSDSAGNKGRARKTNSKKKNAEKRPVHKRVKELVREMSTQSSEEDSDGTFQMQSGKEQHHLRSVASPKKNVETHNTSDHDRKAESSSKGKGKTQSDSEKVSSKKQALKVFRQTASKDSKRKKDVLPDEVPWTNEEIKKLTEALYTIPGNAPMFWQKISRKVGTRSAQECQFQHQGQVLVSNKKEPSVKKGSAKEKKDPGHKAASQQNVKIVSGGIGTIKRKRELRELLEQQDVDYEDDIFDSTPFKRKKDLKLPFNLSAHSSNDEEDDNEGDNESDTEHNTSYKTPSSRTPSSRFRPLGPLSMSATPGAEFVSPSLLQQVNRKDMDHYIYRMQQGKRGTQAAGKQKSKPIRTSTPKKLSSSRVHMPVLAGSEFFEAHPLPDHDSDEGEEDYYFSDE